MEVVIGKTSGFCAGVKNTINKAHEILKNNDKVYCLGEIVHNELVVKSLEDIGMITVEDISSIPDNSKVIFRAHGEALSVYEEAKRRNIEIYDLTCGKIVVIHKQIIDNNDKYIVIIGKKSHPEIIGTAGFAKTHYVVMDDIDIDDMIKDYKASGCKDIYITSQTTFSSKKFDELVSIIKSKIDTNIIVNKSICNATEKRQSEVEELSRCVDAMIIIGGKNSSNTKELYNIARNNCSNVYLVQDEFDIDELSYNKVGVMAGASTPNDVVDRVINKIRGYNE